MGNKLYTEKEVGELLITKNLKRMKTLTQVTKLRPEFKFGGMTMIDWFEVSSGHGFCCIRSGSDMLTVKQNPHTIMKIVSAEKMLKKRH
jgi:hypothetical protein